MAKKTRAPKTASAEAAAGADDLQVMHPNLTAIIGGRAITMREYGFIEGLALRPVVQPLLDSLHDRLLVDGEASLEEITLILGRHADIIQQLVAQAADVQPEWVAALKQNEGHNLLMLWWTANGPFYVSCVYNRIMAAAVEKQARAGQMSMQSSSPATTETLPPLVE